MSSHESVDRRSFLTMLGAAASIGGAAAPSSADAQGAAPPSSITLLGFGGPFDEVTKKYVAEPFTKATGIPVIIRGGSSSMTGALLAQADHPQYDLVHFGYEAYVLLDERGALDPIGLPARAQRAHTLSGRAPSARCRHDDHRRDAGLQHRQDQNAADLMGRSLESRLQGPRLNRVDAGAVRARHAGHGRSPRGGNEYNIDPGFAKLRELKPNLAAIYQTSSQCAQLFAQGGVWIAPWYSGRVASTRTSGVPVARGQHEGRLGHLSDDALSPSRANGIPASRSSSTCTSR